MPFSGLSEGTYGAILADPPWRFVSYDRKTSIPHRQQDQPYSTMTRRQLREMPVADLGAKDCVLFMWVIDTHLDQGIELGEHWGFKYKTRAFEWFKVKKGVINPSEEAGLSSTTNYRTDPWEESDLRIGMGYWTRKQCESCLLFTRGKPSRISASVRQAIFAPRREHSRKPDEQYDRIEKLVSGPYAELFARRWHLGWDGWGEEYL